MRINLVGALIRNFPFASEIAFKKGLERNGHTVTPIDTSRPGQLWDYDADATVVFKELENPKYYLDLKLCKGKKIVYQPDDMRYDFIKSMMVEMRKHCEYAFTFDNDGAQAARDIGYRDANRLLLTADDELYKPMPEFHKDISVSFIANFSLEPCHVARRRAAELVRQSFNSTVIGPCFAVNSVVKIYNRSKVTLNHATCVGQPFGHGYGYQSRIFEIGLTKTCFLSNVIENEEIVIPFEKYNDERTLLEQLDRLVVDQDAARKSAEELYDCVKKFHSPQARAAEMVDMIERFK